MTYSSYEKQWETKYKVADAFEGPWITPAWDDKFDGRDFYAAKTVFDGKHRYLVGWQSIRKDCKNDSPYVWGGNVVVHELVQRKNGELGVKMPDTIRQAFTSPLERNVVVKRGEWDTGKIISGKAAAGFGLIELSPMKNVCLIKATLKWTKDTHAVGIMFHIDGEKMEQWCQLRLELSHNRIALEKSGKTEKDQFFDEERPIHFREDQYAEITVLTSNDIIVVYVDDVALCGRCYNYSVGNAGVFVEYGEVQVKKFEVLEGEEQNIIG